MLTSALFIAMTTALTYFIKIPVANGYIHAGDGIVYLAACVLPAPYALFAAGIGGALADIFSGYPLFSFPTFIIKALITLLFTSKNDTVLTKRNALMVLPAGMVTVTGYFLAGWMFYGWEGAVPGLLGDVIQAAGSAILFLVLASAFDKNKLKQKLVR